MKLSEVYDVNNKLVFTEHPGYYGEPDEFVSQYEGFTAVFTRVIAKKFAVIWMVDTSKYQMLPLKAVKFQTLQGEKIPKKVALGLSKGKIPVPGFVEYSSLFVGKNGIITVVDKEIFPKGFQNIGIYMGADQDGLSYNPSIGGNYGGASHDIYFLATTTGTFNCLNTNSTMFLEKTITIEKGKIYGFCGMYEREEVSITELLCRRTHWTQNVKTAEEVALHIANPTSKVGGLLRREYLRAVKIMQSI